MDSSVQEFDRARSRMAGDLRAIITDSEDLLAAAATVSGEGFTAARTKFEKRLRNAKARLADVSQPMIDGTRQTAAVADDYVRDNPWTVAGIAIAVGVLIGLLAAKRSATDSQHAP